MNAVSFGRWVWVCLALHAGCGPRDAVAPPAPSAVADAGTPRAATESAPVSSAFAKVQKAEGATLVEVPAQVLGSATQRAEVMPAFRAQVVSVQVEPGQQVTAGTPLVVVRMPEVVRAAGAYLAAGLRQSAFLQRQQQLQSLRGEGLARLSDIAETAASLSEASAAQKEALSTLQAAGLSAQDAAAIADGGGRVTLRSPLAGVVMQVSAATGQIVEPGSSPALVRVAGSGETRIEAHLPILNELPLHFELASAQTTTPLRLLRQAPVLDPRDGMALSWFEPSGPHRLLPGQSGRLRAVMAAHAQDKAPKLLLIPSRALQSLAQKSTVRRRRDGKMDTIAVDVLLQAAGLAVVKPSDPVALTAQDTVAVSEQSASLGQGTSP